MTTSARAAMMAARTALVLDQPFYGLLSLRLRLQEDPSCATAWVDGTTLGYNPKFVLGLSPAQRVGLVAHEVMHCAHGHPWRRSGREMRKWQRATDRASNPLLDRAGLTLPPDALLPTAPDHYGKSAEWLFDREPDEPESDQGGGGDAEGDGDGEGGSAYGAAGFGEVRDAPPSPNPEASLADWQQAAQQAAALAQAAGQLPQEEARRLLDGLVARVDWQSVLRRFMTEAATQDYRWSRPNRRYLAHGLILPGLYSEELGEVVVAIDTSGSVDSVTLGYFAAELQALMEDAQPRQLTVLYIDAQVHAAVTFYRGDTVVLDQPIGGGGTRFRPAFDWIAEQQIDPAAFAYLTDMQASDWEEVPADPPFPVLWLSTSPTSQEPPCGEVVWVQD